MRRLSCTGLSRTNDPRQVFTVDVTIDGVALHIRAELRYLPAPEQLPAGLGLQRTACGISRSTAKNRLRRVGREGKIIFLRNIFGGS